MTPRTEPDVPILIGGAIGTQLAGSGFDLERDLDGYDDAWELLVETRPEQVQAVHESYLDAGADFVSTHTFMTLPSALGRHGLANETVDLTRRAVRLARAAAIAWSTDDSPRGVIGVIGPGIDLPSRGGRSRELLAEETRQVAETMVRESVDVICLETAVDPIQIEVVGRTARDSGSIPLWISMAPDAGGLASGFDLAESVAAARAAGADLLALNCGRGPEAAARTLPPLRDLWDGPLGFWPAASEDGSPGDPERFAATVAAAVERFDLRVVGGCCGTGPAHIRRLAQAIGHRGPDDDWYDEIDAPAIDSPDLEDDAASDEE